MLTTTQNIIDKFEEYIGDATAMSSVQTLELADKIYHEILEMHEWEFLKKESSGSVNGTSITKPSDFARFTNPPIIYVGDNGNNPYKVIPYTERRLYTNQNNFAYYDARQGTINFFRTVNNTYSFDYIYLPTSLDLSTNNPVWPARFNYAIVHMMCLGSDIMELSEKARSYAPENMAKAEKIINDMRYWSDSLSSYLSYGN